MARLAQTALPQPLTSKPNGSNQPPLRYAVQATVSFRRRGVARRERGIYIVYVHI
jgi:hypothetical protein